MADKTTLEMPDLNLSLSQSEKLSHGMNVSPSGTEKQAGGELLPAKAIEKHKIGNDYWVETAPLPNAAYDYQNDWENLIEKAVEPNIFNEPWYLKLCQEYLVDQQIEMVFVYHREKNPAEKPYLCAAIPLIYKSGQGSLGWLKVAMFPDHEMSYLNMPHFRKGYVLEAMSAFFRWMSEVHPEVALLEMRKMPGEGPFAQALLHIVNTQQYANFPIETYNRALLVPDESSTNYLELSMSNQQLRETKRKRRRLEEQGKFELRSLKHTAELAEWTNMFLELEKQGWKGSNQTAIDQSAKHREFVTRMLRRAMENNQLEMYGYFLDGKPIAMKCNLRAGIGGFAWKIAYDEAYSKFSPGVLLETETVHKIHLQSEIKWMDSCAAPQHPMIDRIWKERRTIRSQYIAMHHLYGHIAVLAMQILKSGRRMWKRKEPVNISNHNF